MLHPAVSSRHALQAFIIAAIREMCGSKQDVITKVEKRNLTRFVHLERTNKGRKVKVIYGANVERDTRRERPRMTFSDQI